MTSYKILDLFIRRWKMNNIEKKIKKHKKIFIESANGKEFDSLLSGFYKCIDQSDENNIFIWPKLLAKKTSNYYYIRMNKNSESSLVII